MLFRSMRNIDDRDVEKFLGLLTFLPMEEVKRLGALEGAEINKAKEVLAFEVTKMIHGQEEAEKSETAARSLFNGSADEGAIPFTEMEKSIFEEGIGILNLLTELDLTQSNGEGRRLVQQGGISIDDVKITDFRKEVTLDDFKDDKILIRKGRKVYHQVRI